MSPQIVSSMLDNLLLVDFRRVHEHVLAHLFGHTVDEVEELTLERCISLQACELLAKSPESVELRGHSQLCLYLEQRDPLKSKVRDVLGLQVGEDALLGRLK